MNTISAINISAAAATPLPSVVLQGPAVLDGGVPVAGWGKPDPAARPWLWQAKVPARLGHRRISQMWDDGVRVRLAHTPVMQYVTLSV